MFRTLLTAWLLALASPVLNAASFAVNPVRLALDASAQPVAALTVRNDTGTATVVQAEVMQWSADGAADRYAPSQALLVTPAVFTLPPHGAQLVRVGLRDRRPPAAGSSEQSYRLYLSEVPAPPAPGFQGLQVSLRLGVPVFVAAPGAGPRLEVTAATGEGELALDTRNEGTGHVRLHRVEVRDGTGATVATVPLARDLLAGQQRAFRVPLTRVPRDRLHVLLHTDAGQSELTVAIPPG